MAFEEQKVATIAVTSSPTARVASCLIREVLKPAAAAAAKVTACLEVACDKPQRSRSRLFLIALMVQMVSGLYQADRVEVDENGLCGERHLLRMVSWVVHPLDPYSECQLAL